MNIIKRATLVDFWERHPETEQPLKESFIKFIGTHAEYHRVDALTVDQH